MFFGPQPDPTRSVTHATITLPANASYSFFWTFRVNSGFAGSADPNLADNKNIIMWGNTTASAGGGNDCFLLFPGANNNVSANRLKAWWSMSKSGVQALASGTILKSSAAIVRNTIYTIVVRYNHSTTTFELVLCQKGGSASVVASGSANATFTGSTRAIGVQTIGKSNWADDFQRYGYVPRVLSDAEVASIAGGTDISTVITGADQVQLLELNAPTSTITATWGSTTYDGTLVGTWTNRPSSTTILPVSGSTYLSCDEPRPYTVFSRGVSSTSVTCPFTGTYNGFTPSAVEGKVVLYDSTVIVNWTALGSFTASTGAWSGTLSVPHGSGNVLLLRDGADHSKTWSGSHPFVVGPAAFTIGQSPHVRMENTDKGVSTLTGEAYLTTIVDSLPEIVLAGTGALGAGYCEAANQFYSVSGSKPVLFGPASVVGTTSDQWAAKTGGTWPLFLSILDASGVKDIEVNWLQGAGDVANSAATIKANLDTILANLQADVFVTRGVTYRFVINPHNRETASGSSAIANEHKVRKAQYEWATQHVNFGTKVFLGEPYLDMITDAELSGTTATYTIGGTNDTITLSATNNTAVTDEITAIVTTDSNGTQQKTVTAYNATTKVATISGHFSPPLTGTVTYIAAGVSPHQGYLGNVRMGTRFGQGLAWRYGYSAVNPQGPRLTSATYPHGGDGSIIDWYFTHVSGTAIKTKNGGTTATNIKGIDLAEDTPFASIKTFLTTTITAANIVRTTQAPASNLANLVGRIHFGEPFDPLQFQWVDDMLRDNNGVGDQGGSPVWPTFDSIAVTEAPAATPTLAITGIATGGTYAFGAVTTGVPSSHQFTITNNGTAVANIGTASISGTGFSISGSDNPSGNTIAVSASRTITVIITAASNGSKTGQLSIPSDDPAQPYVINFTATASSGGGSGAGSNNLLLMGCSG